MSSITRKFLPFHQYHSQVRSFGLASFVIPALVLLLKEHSVPNMALGLVGVSALWLFWLGLTWRIGLGSLISGSTLMLFIWIHLVKTKLLNQHFLALDITFFLNQFIPSLLVIVQYKYLIVEISLGMGLFLTIVTFGYKAESPLPTWKSVPPLLVRGFTTFLSLLLLPVAFFIINSFDHPFLRSLKTPNPWDLVAPSDNILSSFILSFPQMQVTIPERQMADVSTTRQLFDTEPVGPTVADRPDIIVWQNESTFDPTVLDACRQPVCRFKMFDTDENSVAGGFLKVHCFGGSSWTSEFAVQTGLDHRVFGEGGVYTHLTLAPRVRTGLAWQLKKLGYRTIVLYSINKNFFNAYKAFQNYGFDEFYAPEDLGLPAGWREVTDQDLYVQMIKLMERDQSRPTFIFVSTMYQHGPHNEPVSLLPEPYKTLRLPGLSEPAQTNLSNYLYRLSLTNATLAQMENRFLRTNSPRKTLLVQYGDHQPGFDGLMPQLPQRDIPGLPKDLRHEVTYFSMKSNFAPHTREHYDYLDVSFLGSLILDVAGLPKDQYFAANAKLRRLCQGKYAESDQKELIARYHDYIFHELKVMK